MAKKKGKSTAGSSRRGSSPAKKKAAPPASRSKRKSRAGAGQAPASKARSRKAASRKTSPASSSKKSRRTARPLLVETARYQPEPAADSAPRDTDNEFEENFEDLREQPAGRRGASPRDRDDHDEPDDDDDDVLNDDRERYMSVGDHLEEFRRRLLGIMGVVIVCAVAAAFFTQPIHEFLTAPYSKLTGLEFFLRKVYGPLEAIIKLALMVGFSFSLPLSLFILWGFVTPALSRKNAWIGYITIAASCFLFWTGMTVSWFYIFPISLEFMFTAVLPLLSGTEARITIEDYYGFLFMVIAGGGLIFQLPLVIVVTGAIGVFPLRWHKQAYRYVIVGIFTASALLTPPDWLSQVIMAGILLVLYAVSLLIVWAIERARRIRSG